MENRRNRTSEELAPPQKELYSFRPSVRAARNPANDDPLTPEPKIEIQFERSTRQFLPSDFLTCEYTVNLDPAHRVQAVEASVIWQTEGKGDTDIGVHFFERRQKLSLSKETFNQQQRLSTVLPASPLTYEGLILKVRWCVRVRLFLADGTQTTQDEYFKLGEVHPYRVANSGHDDEDSFDSAGNPNNGETESGAA